MLSHFHGLSRCLTSTPATSIEQKLEQVIELNKSASFFNRWAVARCTGSLGVSATAAREAMHEMVAGVQIAYRAAGPLKYERLRRINPFVNCLAAESARFHFYQAGRHVVAAIVALVLGVLSPSTLLIPAMKKVGFEANVSTTLPGKVKVAVGIGLGVLGLALLTTFVRSRIPKAVVLSVPPAKLSVAAIAARVLGGVALIFCSNGIAYKIVKKSGYGPFSRVKLDCWQARAHELPFLNVPVSLVTIAKYCLQITLGVMSREVTLSDFAEYSKFIGRRLVTALPIIGNLTAIFYFNQLDSDGELGENQVEKVTSKEDSAKPTQVFKIEDKEHHERHLKKFFNSLSLVGSHKEDEYEFRDDERQSWTLTSGAYNNLYLWNKTAVNENNPDFITYDGFAFDSFNGVVNLRTDQINDLLTRYQDSDQPQAPVLRQFLKSHLPPSENKD